MGATDGYRTLASRYAQAVDTGDVEGFVSLFLPDAAIKIDELGNPERSVVIQGHDRLRMVPQIVKEKHTATLHILGQSTYDQVSDDEVHATVYCSAHHLNRAKGINHIMRIIYSDRCVRDEDGEWRFAERRLNKLWTETNPVDPLPEGATA